MTSDHQMSRATTLQRSDSLHEFAASLGLENAPWFTEETRAAVEQTVTRLGQLIPSVQDQLMACFGGEDGFPIHNWVQWSDQSRLWLIEQAAELYSLGQELPEPAIKALRECTRDTGFNGGNFAQTVLRERKKKAIELLNKMGCGV